ncbi:MAG: hypothetical protein DRG20_02340 [Deltaproteobacteria bacterium]|nr:MAG: hypothetical protein DRG20_02340 [Deltaproteobacteria bacterium]
MEAKDKRVVLDATDKILKKLVYENQNIRRKLDLLINRANENWQILKNLFEIDQSLINQKDILSLLLYASSEIRSRFNLYYVNFSFFKNGLPLAIEGFKKEEVINLIDKKMFINLFSPSNEIFFINKGEKEKLSLLFKDKAKEIASAVIIPLTIRKKIAGSLNLGSDNADRYKNFMGIDFLNILGRKLSSCIEQKIIQEELLNQERLKVTLEIAGAAAHEINQPLSVLIGRVELLLSKLENGGITKKDLNVILDAAKRIENISSLFSNITCYCTKPYANNQRIVDIFASSINNSQTNKKDKMNISDHFE